MLRIIKQSLFLFFIISIFNSAFSSEYFKEGVKLFEGKKYEDAKLMFERSIIFNPKDSNSYLYLAKIYNQLDEKRKEEKNLDTTLLIEPENEEAVLMLMKINLEKSNYFKVKELSKTFANICKSLCDENKKILETLANIEPKNES